MPEIFIGNDEFEDHLFDEAACLAEFDSPKFTHEMNLDAETFVPRMTHENVDQTNLHGLGGLGVGLEHVKWSFIPSQMKSQIHMEWPEVAEDAVVAPLEADLKTRVIEIMKAVSMASRTDHFLRLLARAEIVDTRSFDLLTEDKCVGLQLPWDVVDTHQRYVNDI